MSMANILAILNPKGGSGKTTLALHLAHALSLDSTVLLVDTDPQGSARDWASQAGGNAFPVVGIDRAAALKSTVNQLSNGYDWIVIDGAAKLEEMGAHAVSTAHLVIIPVQPSPLDLWACESLVSQVKQRQAIADGAPTTAFQITRAKKGTNLAREIREVVKEYGLPLFDGSIHDRTIFAKSLAEGKTALNLEPDGEACWEIHHLIKQIKGAFDA
ncbi:MAG: AAA family ATPase [Candidatus Thioglobus sp.]|nr:AAA family ATPase [Candidatus Thioglobus sp.]